MVIWPHGLRNRRARAFIPSYSQIGVAAPALLVIFRLLQGFAVGGEVGPSSAFLIESAPESRRGLYVALQMATQYLAVVAAGVVGFALSAWLSAAQLDAWGWRVALLIGAVIVPLGLYLRQRLPEESPSAAPLSGAPPAGGVPIRLLVLCLMMIAAGTITAYTLGYMNTYMQDTLKFSTNAAFGETILEGLSVVFLALIGGSLSDRFGRKVVMLGGLAALLVLVLPGYHAIGMSRNIVLVYAVSATLNGLYGLLRVRRVCRHRRVFASVQPLGHIRSPVRHRHCRIRRIYAVHHQVAHRCHGTSAGAGLVLERGADCGRCGHVPAAGIRSRAKTVWTGFVAAPRPFLGCGTTAIRVMARTLASLYRTLNVRHIPS